MMDIKPEELPRFRALMALTKFSPAVQSDVLADGTIAARFDIPVSQPVRLWEQIVVDRTLLFSAFQKAADSLPIPPFLDQEGKPLDLSVVIEVDSAVIMHEDKKWRFAFAPFLSLNQSRRLTALASCLRHHTLTSDERATLERLMSQSELSHRDFVVATTILFSSPESFAASLREKAILGQLSMRDPLPQHLGYWYHLVHPSIHSATLDEFIAVELSSERRTRIGRNPADALVVMSLTFASPSLVPRDLLKDLAPDAVLEGINRVAAFDDPFALCGAFDVCIDRALTDSRFVAAGERILGRLFDDMKRLTTSCDLFAAIFVIATAYLAEHECLRRRPVYWRRLAAASHAALVLRTLGVNEADHEPLLTWAMRVKGRAYFLSVLNEFSEDPRWRPDWIASHFLMADVCGRLSASSRRLPAGEVPWQQRLDTVQPWIGEKQFGALTCFPVLLEGTRPSRVATLRELTQATDAYQRLIDERSAQLLLMMTPAVQILGFPMEAADAVFKIVHSLRIDTGQLEDEVLQAVMTLAAHIAVQIRDVRLADLVADFSIERCAANWQKNSVADVVFKVVECAAANTDREDARIALAKRLESLAFLLPQTALPTLSDLVITLQLLDDELATHLGRALAIARLGIPRIAA